MNALTTVTPAMGLAVLEKGVSLCHSIIEYRKATFEINVQREEMHREADLAMQKLEMDFTKEIKRIEKLAQGMQAVLSTTKNHSKDMLVSLERINEQILASLQVLSSSKVSEQIKHGIQTTLDFLLQSQQSMLDAHIDNNRVPMQAYLELSDNLRNQPRTFTDVN